MKPGLYVTIDTKGKIVLADLVVWDRKYTPTPLAELTYLNLENEETTLCQTIPNMRSTLKNSELKYVGEV